MSILSKSFVGAVVAAIAAVWISTAFAQDYPTRQIRLINPWSPGGPADAIARPLAEKLSQALGQPVVMENRAGANGMVAHEYVSRARPDGYTILLSHVGPMAISPAIEASVAYDSMEDFEHITLFTSQQLLLGVRQDLPIQTLQEFIDYAKANPGMTYGTVGVGSTTHLAVEWLASAAEIEVIHIPYNGATPLMVDMLGERIDFAFLALASFVPYLDQITPIALSTTNPSRILPDTPPVSDLIPDFDVSSWHGLEVPAGTPREIVDRLAEETNRILADPEMIAVLETMGMSPEGGSPEEHAEKVSREMAIWTGLVEQAGVKKTE